MTLSRIDLHVNGNLLSILLLLKLQVVSCFDSCSLFVIFLRNKSSVPIVLMYRYVVQVVQPWVLAQDAYIYKEFTSVSLIT